MHATTTRPCILGTDGLNRTIEDRLSSDYYNHLITSAELADS